MGNIKSTPSIRSSKSAVTKGKDRRARKEIDRLQEDLNELYHFLKKVKGTKDGASILEDFVVQRMATVSSSQELFLLEVSERSGTESVTSYKTADHANRRQESGLIRSKTI